MRSTYVRRLRTNLLQLVAAPKSLAALGVSLVLIMSACASGPAETGSGAPTDPIASPTPVVIATTGPTSLVTPTTDPSSTATAVPPSTAIPENTATPGPAASSTPLATAALTATTRPIPTAQATAQPTATQPTATPRPATATAVPPTPTPTSTWVNPDCFVGPGAADEPVWWCGGKICVVGSPHYGCPSTVPAQPYVLIDCTISDSDIEVNEIITLTAVQTPADAPVRYAFSHGDGTIDNTSVSRAFYEAPGSYTVTLLWQYNGGKGSKSCGTVHVRPVNAPTPTVTPTPDAVQIGCSISPRRPVEVNETLTFRAFQSPANVPVTYVFDHGDGTLDETSQSLAYYAAPGFYQVRLNWAHDGQSGTTFCGTVTVEPNFSASDYLGRTPESADALAISRGLTTRIVRIDDQVFPGTEDYRLDRVNIEVDANIVTEAYLG